jgi:glycosyltransferase involved in cell wall biosynthesis
MPISVYFKEVLQKELGTSPDKYLPVSESASSFFLNYPTNVNQSVLLKKRFIYVGEMSKQRQLNTILDAFDVVFKKYYNIELVMIGWGISDRDVMNLKEYAAQLPSGGSIVFMEKINYEDIPKIVTTCIAGLSPIPPIDIYLISTPTKCIEYVSLGVPVIANREIYDQNEFVTQSEGGLLVNYSAIEFAEAMTYMIEHTEKVKTMGENGRKWLNQHRSFHLLSETIEDRYNSIIN